MIWLLGWIAAGFVAVSLLAVRRADDRCARLEAKNALL